MACITFFLDLSPLLGGCKLSQVAGAGNFASSPALGVSNMRKTWEKPYGELWTELDLQLFYFTLLMHEGLSILLISEGL